MRDDRVASSYQKSEYSLQLVLWMIKVVSVIESTPTGTVNTAPGSENLQ